MYRKFSADYLFNGHDLLLHDEVLITDEKGMVVAIVEKEDAGDDIEKFVGLLSPGFINAHCHLELSHLKGDIPTHTGLVEFVQQVITKREKGLDLINDAMLRADQEMYDCGIVAVGDICNTPDSIGIKLKSKLHWHNFIEVTGFVDAVAEKKLDEIKKVHALFKAIGNKQSTTLSPHAPYSVSKRLFEQLNHLTADQLITIHNQECAAENELYQYKSGDLIKLYDHLGIDISKFQPTGNSSLQSWLPLFTNKQSIILVHNTYTDQDDISFSQLPTAHRPLPTALRPPPIFFCLCPNANNYIEGKMPPVELLRKNNAEIIIGTDSYASNQQLDLLEEIKTIQHESSFAIPLKEVLKWATANGARALQLDEVLGSFEKGKTPGIVLIDALSMMNITLKSKAKRIL